MVTSTFVLYIIDISRPGKEIKCMVEVKTTSGGRVTFPDMDAAKKYASTYGGTVVGTCPDYSRKSDPFTLYNPISRNGIAYSGK